MHVMGPMLSHSNRHGNIYYHHCKSDIDCIANYIMCRFAAAAINAVTVSFAKYSSTTWLHESDIPFSVLCIFFVAIYLFIHSFFAAAVVFINELFAK